jgi:hypothetical protein
MSQEACVSNVNKKKLLEDIKQNPARIYRAPGDVLRDRRFADTERLQILKAWRETATGLSDLAAIDAMILEVEERLYADDNQAAQ